jgi:hypothetical protein
MAPELIIAANSEKNGLIWVGTPIGSLKNRVVCG